MKNYFRIGLECIFFDDQDGSSLGAAYARSRNLVGACLFRPCPIEGPWNDMSIVGHRPRSAILFDLNEAIRAGALEDAGFRALELKALKDRFGGQEENAS